MKKLVVASVLVLAATALAAHAQDRRPGGASITLYDQPNFQGQSRTFAASVANLADQGFNDRAQSLRVQGVWRVCEDSRLRGRCVEVSGNVPNLADLRLTGAISSFENTGRFPAGPGPRPPFPGGPGGPGGPGPGPGFGGQSLAGQTATFFPNPRAGQFRSANDFCRSMGFARAIYSDTRSRDLRDVLCQR